MAMQRQAALGNRVALVSAVGFTVAGGFLVLLGSASILTGQPVAAHDLAPLTGLGDVLGRLGQVGPLLCACAAALVAGVVAVTIALRRLDTAAAAAELLVLGLVVEACILGSAGRIGHATDGSVLGATVVCVMGGAAVFAAGIVALLARE